VLRRTAPLKSAIFSHFLPIACPNSKTGANCSISAAVIQYDLAT
jgi:hypothetical protein